jgi:hypothetical protein
MKPSYTRNKRPLGIAFFAVLILSAALYRGFPGETGVPAPDVPTAAAPVYRIDDEDAVTLLSLGLGGQDVAAAAWSAMNASEKQALRDQAALIESMAQAAEQEGLLASPDVERAVRWGRNAYLADAWEKKTAAEADLSDSAARVFYEANLQRYLESAAVRYRQVTYSSGQKKAAASAKKRLRKASLDSLKECVTVDWVKYDALPPVLAGALRSAPLLQVMGPLEVPGGHVLYQVLERRKEEPAPFEKCKDQIKSDLVKIAIKEKLENLKKLP